MVFLVDTNALPYYLNDNIEVMVLANLCIRGHA